MKNLSMIAGLCLLVFASCKKSFENEETTALQRITTLSVCSYDSAQLLSNLQTLDARRKPTPTPIPTPTTPTGSDYSCIYIDFNGQNVSSPYWNGGATLNCAPSGLNTDQMIQVLNEVRVLYAANKVVVTADEAVYAAAKTTMRTRVVVTPTSAWYTGVSGVAYTGSFTWGDDTPAFVFSDRLYFAPHYVAEIVAHESGHTLGLKHQSEYSSDCILVNRYKSGAVMGNSLNSIQGQWIFGTTSSCNTYQDDNQLLMNLLGPAF